LKLSQDGYEDYNLLGCNNAPYFARIISNYNPAQSPSVIDKNLTLFSQYSYFFPAFIKAITTRSVLYICIQRKETLKIAFPVKGILTLHKIKKNHVHFSNCPESKSKSKIHLTALIEVTLSYFTNHFST